jgi:hypothetical protein
MLYTDGVQYLAEKGGAYWSGAEKRFRFEVYENSP